MSHDTRKSLPEPTMAVGAILFDERERVLLIQRGKEPGRGKWTVPGGHIEAGESPAAACIREMREETGLEVEVIELAEVIERMSSADDPGPAYNFVIMDFLVRRVGGRLAHSSDAMAAEYVALGDVARRDTTEGLAAVLGRALDKLHRHQADGGKGLP